MVYNYDEKTGEYIGTSEPRIDSLRTKALGKTVLMNPPSHSTTKKPPAEVGKCWFVNDKWTKKKPAELEAPIDQQVI